jgi:outer membrane protein OmpA-like peptidoglycan-associated protein
MNVSRVWVYLLALALTLPLGVRSAAAQGGEAVVHDLTAVEVTEEQLIEILTPKSGSPEPLRARGLGVVARPSCASQRREMTRGIAPKPVTDVAAIRVHFAFDSAELLPEARRELEVLARVLGSPQLTAACFRIEGHADSVGSDAYNHRLSQARADAVVRYLVDGFRLDPERLLPVGFGEREPIAENETEAGRARNRRVQIANLGAGEAGS